MNIDEGYNTLDGVRHNMTGVTAVSVGTSTTVPPFPILQMRLQAQTQVKVATTASGWAALCLTTSPPT